MKKKMTLREVILQHANDLDITSIIAISIYDNQPGVAGKRIIRFFANEDVPQGLDFSFEDDTHCFEDDCTGIPPFNIWTKNTILFPFYNAERCDFGVVVVNRNPCSEYPPFTMST